MSQQMFSRTDGSIWGGGRESPDAPVCQEAVSTFHPLPRETDYQIRLIFNAEHTVWFIMNLVIEKLRELGCINIKLCFCKLC